MSPIIKHGYAPRQGRKGTTRRQQKINAQVLREERECWYCGEPGRTDDPLEVAHVIAWSMYGSDDRENLRAAHLSCNRERGAL